MKKILIFLFMIFACYSVKAYDFSNDPEKNMYDFVCVYSRDNRGIGAQIFGYNKNSVGGRFRITGNVNQEYKTPNGISDLITEYDCPDEVYYIFYQASSTQYEFYLTMPTHPVADNGYKIGKMMLSEICVFEYNEQTGKNDYVCDSDVNVEGTSGDYYSSPNVDKYGQDDGEIKPPSSNKTPNYNLGIFEYCDENGCSGTSECPTIFGRADDPDSIFGFMSKYIFTPIRWLTPVILIVLTSLDFAKAIFVDEKDGMGKAKSNFGKRAVAALIIFLAPTIVSILLTLIDGANVSRCMNNTEIGNL